MVYQFGESLMGIVITAAKVYGPAPAGASVTAIKADSSGTAIVPSVSVSSSGPHLTVPFTVPALVH